MIVWNKAKQAFQDVELMDAQDGILSGAYLPENRKIPLTGPDGAEIFDSDPRKVGKYLQDGYRLASKQEVVTYEAQDEGWLALGLGVGDALSMGALNMTTEALERGGYVARGTADEWRAARKENPWAYGAGSVAGALSPMAGGALAARGAVGAGAIVKGLGSGPAIIDKAARGLQRATLNKFGGGAATATARVIDGAGKAGMAGQATGLAGAGAYLGTEGALYGTIQGLSEADFGDPNVAGSQIMAAVGMHALYGAGLGIAGGVALKGLAATPKAMGSLYEMATGAPAKLDKFRIKRFEKLATPELAKKMATAKGRADVLGPDIVPKHSAAIGDAMDASQDALKPLLRDGFVGSRIKGAKAKLPKDNAPQQAKAFEQVGDFTEALTEYGQRVGGKLGKQIQAIAAKVVKQSDDYPAALQAMNEAESELVKLTSKARTMRAAGIEESLAPSLKAGLWEVKGGRKVARGQMNVELPHAQEVLLTAGKDARRILQSADLWGDEVAGIMTQSDTFMGRAHGVSDATRKAFLDTGPTGKVATNREKLSKWLDRYADPKNDIDGLTLQDQITMQRDLVTHLKGNLDLDNALRAQVKALDAATKRLEKGYAAAGEKLTARNQVREMDAAMRGEGLGRVFSEQGMGGFIGGRGMLGGAAVIGMLGSPVMAAKAVGIGWAAKKMWKGLDGVYNPAGYYIRKAELEAKRQATATHIKTGVKETLRKKRSAIARRAPPIARRIMSPALTSMLGAPNTEKRNKAQQESITELQQIVADPSQVADAVAQTLGQTADEMPNITNAMALKVVTNARWILDNSTQGQRPPTLFGKPANLSDFELQKYEQQLAISQDPLRAVDLLAARELTLADIQALQAMWPEIYSQLHAETMEQLAEMKDHDDIDYGTRIQLGILFSTATDPSMEFEQIIAAQAANAAMKQRQQPGDQQQPGNGPALMNDTGASESIMAGATETERTAQSRA